MEEFRKKIKKDNIIYCWFMAIGLIGSATMIAFKSYVDYLGGFCVSLIIVSLMLVIRNRKALGDEKRLKELYIRNTDERNVKIATCSAKATFYVIIYCLAIGSIAAGFFSKVVSCTLSVCFFGVMLVYLAVTAYYNKKM